MDQNNEVVFNNQTLNTNSAMNQVGNNLPVETPVYNQGRHKQLLDFLKDGNVDGFQSLLNESADSVQLINLIDPSFKQSLVYGIVNMLSEEKAHICLQKFLEKGGRINVKDVHGQSPLFYICKDGKISLLNLFLENNADINETDNFRQTPLFYASREGKEDMVKAMISQKAWVNHRDKVEQTPLFYAARYNRRQAAQTLLENGADINITDLKKQTALYFARQHGHHELDKFLVDMGAINTKDGILKQSDLKKAPKTLSQNKSAAPLSEVSIHRDKKLDGINNKKKKGGFYEEPRLTYRLQFTDGSTLLPNELNEADFEKFKQEHPQIAKILLNPDLITSSSAIARKVSQETWQTSASQLLANLWKIKESNVFHAPVDFHKLGIPDYLTVITNPMDFGTIKVL